MVVDTFLVSVGTDWMKSGHLLARLISQISSSWRPKADPHSPTQRLLVYFPPKFQIWHSFKVSAPPIVILEGLFYGVRFQHDTTVSKKLDCLRFNSDIITGASQAMYLKKIKVVAGHLHETIIPRFQTKIRGFYEKIFVSN